ncbi:hypothetical protein ACTFIT_004025 [Dictyostelium discoideum]
MAFGTQKESSSSSSIFNNYNISNKQQKQQQDNNKNNSNLSVSSFFYQINNHIHSFATQFYWKENLDSPHCKEENTHITCRGNIISNQQQQQQQQQEQQSTGSSPKSQTIKNSSNNKNNNNNTSPRKNKNKKSPTMNSFNSNKLFKKSLTSSSDSSSDEYSESEEEEEQVEEDEENSDEGDLNDKSTKFLSNNQKSIHEQEDLADDDSSDLDSNHHQEEEDYSLTSEEEEILSDDESTDKSSSSEEEEDSESESESEEESGNDSSSSVTDESDEEDHNREWSNVNSNLSLKKSVSSILFKFTDCDSTSDSDEEMDSSSGQEGSFSDKDIDVFDDSFLQVPTSYSINISPRKSSEQLKQQSGDFEEVDGGYLGQKPLVSKINENKFNNGSVASSDDDDDELNNGNNNRYYDDSEEELNREIVKREQENDKKVLVAIRKSINGINSGDNESMVEKPCWYGFEDDNHIKVIFQHYSSFLQIDQEVKHTLRGPKPFIGRVHRRAIKYDGGEVGCKFTTLDTVKVYRWEIQPIGRPLNLYKSFVLLTRWDEENGLPTKFQKVNSLSNKDFWANEAKSLKSQSKISSYLYCSPMFDTDFTFNYSIDSEKYPVDFLPNSPILSSRRHHNHHHHSNSDGGFDHQQQQQQNHHSPKQYLHPLTSLNRNNKLSDSQLLPSIKTPTLSVGGIVPQRRSSHPSLLLSSHIYSHSITFGFKDKCNNDLN